MEEFVLKPEFLVLQFIISSIVTIVFFVMAFNLAKTKKATLRMQDIIIAWAKKEGVTKEKKCPGCNRIMDLPFNQPKGDIECPLCGHKNHIDFSEE